jgi:uncharacterized protein (TIGR02996 family)
MYGASVPKRPSVEADLLAAVYVTPDDDTPRLVYADWLQQRGDPRGEFIALQIARASGKAKRGARKLEDDLLAAHGARWADQVLGSSGGGVRFERGFIVDCNLMWMTPTRRIGSPAFNTVRRVHCYDDAIHRLAKLTRPLQIETLAWTGPSDWGTPAWDEATAAFSKLRVLPRLRRLEIDPGSGLDIPDLQWAWTAPCAIALDELSLIANIRPIGGWLGVFAAARWRRLELGTRAAIEHVGWRVILERGERHAPPHLALIAPARLTNEYERAHNDDALREAVAALEPGMLSSARVAIVPALWGATAELRRTLQRTFAKLRIAATIMQGSS